MKARVLRGVRRSCLALLTSVLACGAPGLAERSEALEAHPAPVLAGSEIDYPPYCIVTPDNQAGGFSVELLRAALKAVGREVTFRVGPWATIKKDLADGRLQALPLVGRTPEREAIYDFTFPYLTMHGAIVVREDNTDIHGPADLRGRRVAVLPPASTLRFARTFEQSLARHGKRHQVSTHPEFQVH